ncbi:MAG: GNAT family N-acetyltransferase [Planctomycetota bacterium]
MGNVQVRSFQREDVPQLLELMRGLATFEGYLDKFAVSEQDLVDHGLGASPRFTALVAELDGYDGLAGMAVMYEIPWTYDLRPTVVMKELFVREDARDCRVGAALLREVAAHAAHRHSPRVIWTVLQDNDSAQRFYARHGGRADAEWQSWMLDEDAIARLAQS